MSPHLMMTDLINWTQKETQFFQDLQEIGWRNIYISSSNKFCDFVSDIRVVTGVEVQQLLLEKEELLDQGCPLPCPSPDMIWQEDPAPGQHQLQHLHWRKEPPRGTHSLAKSLFCPRLSLKPRTLLLPTSWQASTRTDVSASWSLMITIRTGKDSIDPN